MESYVDANGDQYWYKDGKRHREDGPAAILANGNQFWFKYGNRHREDGPSVIYPDGHKFWYRDGKLHREDGPAIIYPDGKHEWYVNGNRHREDGPAVSIGLYEMWYENNKFMKSNAMDFDINHYLNNTVPILFLYNVKYEVFNMIIGIKVHRKLPYKTVYKNCVINFEADRNYNFIDCVFIETIP